jgi:MFS family permease
VRRLTFPLYVGGFLGPFGGAMLIALIPNVARGLDASVGVVAAAITAYMVPFAALQLVSGTVAERLTLAPVLGGALGEVSWRLAFVLVAAVSALLALRRQSLGSFERAAGTSSARALLNRWIALLAAKAMLGYLGFTAIGFVLVLVAADEFDLGSSGRGLLVAGYGVGGILLGRYAGSVVDRAGRPSTALAGALVCALGVAGLVLAPTVWALALVYFGIGSASAFVWAGLNTIAVESFPENRAGATSAYSAFEFAGVAVAPLVYVPLFEVDTRAPFVLAAGFTLALAFLVLPWFARSPR